MNRYLNKKVKFAIKDPNDKLCFRFGSVEKEQNGKLTIKTSDMTANIIDEYYVEILEECRHDNIKYNRMYNHGTCINCKKEFKKDEL